MSPPLNVLLLGKGGREHALAWKLAHSPRLAHLHVLPGNAGTAALGPAVSNATAAVAPDDYRGMVELAKQLDVGLVVVGPDDAVVDGVEGYFRQAGIPCFSPSKQAAEVEGSKAFAKAFMQRHDIPTARFAAFRDFAAARAHLEQADYRVVIKASGLAAGKGVVLPESRDEAVAALEDMMLGRRFGDAGAEVVIEEFLDGVEVSVLTLSDGRHRWSFPPAQDHKRVGEGDVGLNTGGMGVIAPSPFVGAEEMERIEREVLGRTFDGLKAEGRTFKGCLFTGLMLTASGPRVLEYNARFGDPETQSLLPLLDDKTDLVEVMLACCEGRLGEVHLGVEEGFACNVIVAAGGYPEGYRQGDEIVVNGLPEDAILFHAGTKLADDKLVTAGGRVLAVVGQGTTLKEAVDGAYRGVDCVKFKDMYFRKDIAYQALAKT